MEQTSTNAVLEVRGLQLGWSGIPLHPKTIRDEHEAAEAQKHELCMKSWHLKKLDAGSCIASRLTSSPLVRPNKPHGT